MQQGLGIVHASQYGAGMAWAQRGLGHTALVQAELPAAAQHLHLALEIFTRLSARLEIGRTHLYLAELAQHQHDYPALRYHGQAAIHVFGPLQVEAYMIRAEHVLQSALCGGIKAW